MSNLNKKIGLLDPDIMKKKHIDLQPEKVDVTSIMPLKTRKLKGLPITHEVTSQAANSGYLNKNLTKLGDITSKTNPAHFLDIKSDISFEENKNSWKIFDNG